VAAAKALRLTAAPATQHVAAMVEQPDHGCAHLVCPVCSAPLARQAGTWRCGGGHSFDAGRHGVVDLLPHGHGRSRRTGDSRDMIAARQRFLDAGHYAPLRDALAEHAAEALAHTRHAVILDAGCGDGYYLAAATTAAGAACGYGFDISPWALRAAARRCRGCTLFVNDVAHRICLADASVDLLINVFAPRNAAEFARVLRPGGRLLVVVPAAQHLAELRQLMAIGAAPDKAATIRAMFAADFEEASHGSLVYPMRLTDGDVANLLAMTPAAWHTGDRAARQRAEAGKQEQEQEQSAGRDELPAGVVTAGFEVLALRRRS
jgi:23S rRNA (guanine745-N1)-methyltransferase